jgi:hypothetical protein
MLGRDTFSDTYVEIAMKPEASVPLPRLVYLLRCWPVETEQGPVWRVSVEGAHDSEHRNFADLNALFEFLEEKTAAHTPHWMEE